MLKNLFKNCQCAAVNEKQSIQKTSIKKMVISLQDVIGQLLNDLDKYHRCFFPSSTVSSYCDQQSAKIPSWKEGNVNSSSFQTSNNFVFVSEWNIKFLILGELSLTVFRVQRKSFSKRAIWACWS